MSNTLIYVLLFVIVLIILGYFSLIIIMGNKFTKIFENHRDEMHKRFKEKWR